MNKIIRFFLAAAAPLTLTACNNDNSTNPPVEPSSTKLLISAVIDEAYLTRAEGNTWHKDDNIGVIATVGELLPESFHPYVNLKFTADNDGTTTTLSGPEMLFYNHLTISGYYPYQGSEGMFPGGSTDGYLIKTDTRIDKQFEGNNKAIDFLHATKTGIKLAEAEQVELAFSHKMTKLTFTFVSNTTGKNKVDVAKLAKYQIEGLVMDGSFNTLTGECIADSDKDCENLVVDELYIPAEKRDETQPLRVMDSLIVFPQTPKGNTQEGNTQEDATKNGEVRLRMFLDEAEDHDEDHYQIYFCTIKFGDNMLKPGYHYNFKVNITKAGLQLGEMTIADWDEGVNSTIVATIDGQEPEFDPNEEN